MILYRHLKRFNDLYFKIEHKVDFHNHSLWVVTFRQSIFLQVLNNDDSKLNSCLGISGENN